MARRTEAHHSRGRRAFGLRGRAWPLSCRGLQSVFGRARWRGVAVRTDRAGPRRYAARPAIAADAADLEIPQRREQRETKQRDHADNEAEREGPEPAAARLAGPGRAHPRGGGPG